MKKTTLALIFAAFTASTLFSSASYADPPGHHGHPGGPAHHNNGHFHPPRGPQHHGNPHHYKSYDHFAWKGHDFRRGHPLPPHFRARDYRIDDWHHRGLHRPPRGSYWSYIDGHYVLIAAATGVVTSIILNSVLNGH